MGAFGSVFGHNSAQHYSESFARRLSGAMINHHVGQFWPVGVFGRAHVHPCGGAAFPVAEEHMDGATGSSEGQRTAVLRERERERGTKTEGPGNNLDIHNKADALLANHGCKPQNPYHEQGLFASCVLKP